MTRRELVRSSFAAGAAFVDAKGDVRDFEQRIFTRANELRAARGAPALLWSDSVAACAREQSERKALLRFPGHNDPERGDVAARLNAAGVAWTACGENLFMERGYDDPVNLAIVSWWYSLGHQENMLKPEYTHTGVGITRAADGAFFATQIFVRPPSLKPESQTRDLQRPRAGKSGR